MEGRIEQINEILKNYIIVEKDTRKEKVDIGSRVVLRDMLAGKNVEYEIVSSIESEPENGKISDESPLGRALLGQKIKDEINVRIPKKTLKLKIIDII
jgi:transcription elongation factor GreA